MMSSPSLIRHRFVSDFVASLPVRGNDFVFPPLIERPFPRKGYCKCVNSVVPKRGTERKRDLNLTVLPPSALIKEPHKYFDHVFITVRSGDGGDGAVLRMDDRPIAKSRQKGEGGTDRKRGRGALRGAENRPISKAKQKGKRKTADEIARSRLKRNFNGSIILPMGGHGGDVVVYADECVDTLLDFHGHQNKYRGKRGGNVNSMGTLTPRNRDGVPAPALRIPVPVGTVVKHKKGKLLADLWKPGDEVIVAKGGHGGVSLLDAPKSRLKSALNLTSNVIQDPSDRDLAHGHLGKEVSLELILRVVADVGIIGLPNAGKSTLMAAVTPATPQIADYPFTTLMPNLGCLAASDSSSVFALQPTLADLPGLIRGAHLGKGLGRNFLRHLRRTRLLIHVVDATSHDPIDDYTTLRDELGMYNPDYIERPYIVVLNKIDVPQAWSRLPSLVERIDAIQSPPDGSDDGEIRHRPHPLSVIGISALKGIRVDALLDIVRAALKEC